MINLGKGQIKVIENSSKAKDAYLSIVKAARAQIMIIFPTSAAFSRQEKMGAIELAKQAARERNVKVRILMPAHKLDKQSVQSTNQASHNPVDVRYIEQIPGTQATILVVDRKVSLVMEIKDDSKTDFVGAIGLSTYSNSRAGVLSYVSIFENLWKQTELYETLKDRNKQLDLAVEELKNTGKMQREFINVAAHELRTPIQPILSLAEVLRTEIGYNDNNSNRYGQLMDVIIRNAKRLHRLTEAVLDVTRIESGTLKLNRETFDLNDVIINAMDDLVLSSEFSNEGLRLLYQPTNVFIEADKGRISQVVSNLLSNAIKFTKKYSGVISISVEQKSKLRSNTDETGSSGQEVEICISDNGDGIDPEILPTLFDKFTSKSYQGTGLGLFISRSIIEAHGGKIWAGNNNDNNAESKKGATLCFTLPISNR
jgi:two-component system, OmpR family, sensor histidine kinase VicK